MSRAKIPVSIDGIEFDALISEERSLNATVPEYPTENGFSVSDAVLFESEKLDMVLFVTNTPVTWLNRHGDSKYRVERVCKELEEKYYRGEPLNVVTSDKTYKNMVIMSIKFSKSVETGYAREIPVSFKKIRITSSKTTTIPKLYGKSGKTGAPAGTASTSTGSSGGSSSSSKSSGSKSGDSGNSKGKSSILHGLASTIGMLK